MLSFCRIRGGRGRIVGQREAAPSKLVNQTSASGGSDLGPLMAVQALERFHVRAAHRSSLSPNIDGNHLHDLLDAADPATTLFIVASKTFVTLETLTNATHRAWPGSNQSWARRRSPAHFRGRVRETTRRWMSSRYTLTTGSRCGTGVGGR